MINYRSGIYEILNIKKNKSILDPLRRKEKYYLPFSEQLKYEDEGAQAGLIGKTRQDCPYDEETQNLEWNHWVYGCENAAGEKAIFNQGYVTVMSTAPMTNEEYREALKPENGLPLDEAIRSGIYKPRYMNCSFTQTVLTTASFNSTQSERITEYEEEEEEEIDITGEYDLLTYDIYESDED